MAMTQNMSAPPCVSSAGPWLRPRLLTTQLGSLSHFAKVPAGEQFSSCTVPAPLCGHLQSAQDTACGLDASGHSCVRSLPRAVCCEVEEWEAGRLGVSQGMLFQPSEEDNPPPNQISLLTQLPSKNKMTDKSTTVPFLQEPEIASPAPSPGLPKIPLSCPYW